MKSDSNICPKCATRSPLSHRHCPACSTALVLDAKSAIAFWRLGNVHTAVMKGIVETVSKSFGLPAFVQPSLLDPRPSIRTGWNGISATAFLNQIDRRSHSNTTLSVGITEENIVPGANWNFLFGYAYLGMPSCVVSLHKMSSDKPSTTLLVKRAATIVIHELGHNLGLDHHDYDEHIACVMTADAEYDCLELLDKGDHRFCSDCKKVVDRKLSR